MTPDLKPAREALDYADQQVAEIGRQWPRVWEQMDHFRKHPPTHWPDWCLLPMSAPATYVQNNPAAVGIDTVARMSALNAWRYSRSAYLFEPGLAERLLGQVPDQITLDDVRNLPEWCIGLASGHPEFPMMAGWLHLEWDLNNDRPELRILIDISDTPTVIPVYLDRASTTEALADYRATAVAGPGADVRGGDLDATVARLAENVDGYLAMAAYLARPEADIVHATRSGVRPVKPRRPKKDTDIWLVGYSDL